MSKSPVVMLSVGIVIGAFGYGIAERLNAPPAADIEAVKATDSAFSGVSESQGPKEAFVRYAVEDVTFLPSGAPPIIGRDALAASFDDWPAGAKLTWQPAGGGIAQSGDLAYTWGMYTMTLPEGDPHQGKYLTVWRRQADGSWRLVADTGNANSPPQATAPSN